MENIFLEDPKLKQVSEQLIQLICEAISSSSTEEKIWVPLEKIRNYVDTYYEGSSKDIDKSFVPTLRMLVNQELIIRKANTFCFMSAETVDYNSNDKKKNQKKSMTKTKK